MSLETDNMLEPKTFDRDPHTIALPSPHPETGKPEFVRLMDQGATLTLDDGSIYRSLGVVANNQTMRMAYINAYIKGGDVIITLLRKEDAE